MPATLPPSLLRERFAKLPQPLREAIASVDTANIILATGRAHGLSIDKIGKLGEEVGYIMGGVAPAKDFIPALEEMLGIPHDQAKVIALEINQKIFLPIREYLKKMHGEKWADEMTGGAKPPPVKPVGAVPAPADVRPPAPTPAPRPPEIRPAPQPQPKLEAKGVRLQAPVIPPVVKAPPPLPSLAAEPEDGGFVKKPEPLVIGPLGRERRGPIEKAFEIKPPPTAAPIQAQAALRPSEVKPTPAPPSAAAKPEVSPKEIKPFQPVIMKTGEELPVIEKVAEEKPAFGPPKPLEYIRAKEEVTKELKDFQKIGATKPAAAAQAGAIAAKPVITKEKLLAEMERVKSELEAKKKAEEKPVPKEPLPPPAAPPVQPAEPKAESQSQSSQTNTDKYAVDPYRESIG